MMSYSHLSRGLGWFSIALGALEMFAPRAVGRHTGLDPFRRMLPALGLREVAAGIGILAAARPAAGLWARVAGDGMDLGVLSGAVRRARARPMRRAAWLSIALVAGVTALDALCAYRMSGGASRR